MVREEYKNKKHTWLILSLMLHSILIAALLVSFLDKNLNPEASFTTPSLIQNKLHFQDKSNNLAKIKKEKIADLKKAEKTIEKAFTVPAPVIFYGNQAMMNLPTPIAGSPDGKSSFDSNPSTLPTPAATAISTEQIAPITENNSKQDTIQNASTAVSTFAQHTASKNLPTKRPLELSLPPTTIVKNNEEKSISTPPPFSEKKEFLTADHNSQKSNNTETDPISQKQSKKQLTLAELFKNAPTALTALGKTGEPSARKAGTEGGDVNGSGHQITIKEGDMKYYTLWAKFLNHLNQAARFNRRGKEHRIHELIQTGAITYILQCAITVDKEGKLIDIELTNSSGSPEFDQLCISDIKSGIPYPPLPDSLGKKIARFEVNVYP